MTREVPQKRLGDLFIFKNGRAFKKEEWATTGLPIIRIQNLNSKDAPFNHFAGEYSSDIFVEPGDRKSTRLNSKSLMRISYAVFCLQKKNKQHISNIHKLHTI